MDWLQALGYCARHNIACVVVMIINVQGSTPRKAGARMVVTSNDCYDSVGGGALELAGIEHARNLLQQGCTKKLLSSREFNLGGELSQCCGGRLTLQFDCHMANDFLVHIFGAGHVAQELARLVPRLPCVTTFHDTRSDWLDRIERQISAQSSNPKDSHTAVDHPIAVNTNLMGNNPFEIVENCAPGAYYIVMTHSHDLDLDIVEAVLTRADSAYCGVIASKSKAAKFRSRLRKKGFTANEIATLTAPLGQHSLTGNTPMEVAVAAISDILHTHQSLLR